MTTCVYALVSPAPARLRLTGMAGETLRVVTVSRIGAIVGEMRRAPAPTVANLRRYAGVIEAIAVKVPAILPARFATTVADREELTFILTSRSAALRRRLRAVRARCQMTIRLVGSAESESDDPRLASRSAMADRMRLRLGHGTTHESESDDAPLASRTPNAGRIRLRLANGATQGTQYLRQRMAMAASERAIPGFEPVRTAVERFVKDERVERRADVVTVNHLVPRAAVTRYLAAVKRAAGEHQLRLMVSGPWAPYAFADNW